MNYRTLPGTGVSVSNLALGTMGFGTETDEPEAVAILDRFVEADGNLVDTSNVYGRGASEELIGRWFASQPADVKCGSAPKKPSPAATSARASTEASIANVLTARVGYFRRYGRYSTLHSAALVALASTASVGSH